MGILDKIKSTVSTGSNDTRGTATRRVGSLAMIMVLLVSMVAGGFVGGAAAASASNINATDVVYNNSAGEYEYTATLQGYSANASETDTFDIDHSSTSLSGFATVESQTDGVTVESQSTSSGVTTVTINTSQSFDGTSDVDFKVSGFDVTASGTGTVSYDTYSTSFAFSPVATGDGEISSVIENDTGANATFDYSVENANGTVIRSASGVDAPIGQYPIPGLYALETGDYSVTVYNISGYDNQTKTLSITENNLTSLSYSVFASTTSTDSTNTTTVDYEFTVEDNGSAVDSFDINLYDGSTIGDNETPVASATVTDNDSNIVTFAGLDDGANNAAEIVYTDADGNEQVYTETFTVDSSQAVNGTVSQTVDVSESSDSDDGAFVGGDAQDDVIEFVTLFTLILLIIGAPIGAFMILVWTGSGVRRNLPL